VLIRRSRPGCSIDVTDLPHTLAVSRVRVVFGPGSLCRLGELAAGAGGGRVLLVTDPGIVRAGHVARGVESIRGAGVQVTVFDGVEENPTTAHVAAGVQAARATGVDLLVGLGGGSSMDAAKGINFILTNGGAMQDYWGEGKATRPMLPFIAVPTTAGTGSEAQSFALISDPVSHQKMACGDEKALAKWAILDPDLLGTVPRHVAAAAGIDAIAHAVETSGTRRRSDLSRLLSRAAWERLSRAFLPFLRDPGDEQVRPDMLLGSHLAGVAIEKSMLGAAHGCANPLTARFGIVHGVAVGLMLPHVVRYNASDNGNPYADLAADADSLAGQIECLLEAAGLPRRLAGLGVRPEDLPELAELASRQWTSGFNPRPVGAAELLEIYRSAL
jgi:alcohol dehydrogenase